MSHQSTAMQTTAKSAASAHPIQAMPPSSCHMAIPLLLAHAALHRMSPTCIIM
jgi:hypothetical protein